MKFQLLKSAYYTLCSIAEALQDITFKPFALLIALKGRNTLNTLRILTTEIASDLEQRLIKEREGEIRGEGNKIRMAMDHFFLVRKKFPIDKRMKETLF